MFPGVGGRTGLGLITHLFHEQFPVEDYGEEHPEYYALVDGKRKLDGFYDGPQLCLSNPEVLVRDVDDSLLFTSGCCCRWSAAR